METPWQKTRSAHRAEGQWKPTWGESMNNKKENNQNVEKSFNNDQ